MLDNSFVKIRWTAAIAALLAAGFAIALTFGQTAWASDESSTEDVTSPASSLWDSLRIGDLSVAGGGVTAGETAVDPAGGNPAEQTVEPATLSPEELLAKATVSAQAQVKGKDWLKTVKAGKVVGTKSKKALLGLKVSLVNTEGVKGSICYRLYSSKSGWTKTVKNGKAAKLRKGKATAVRIWLKGAVSKYFDVYYQGFIKGYGWLDWASNKQVAGTTKLSCHLSAIRVKLVKKGEAFKEPTTTYRLKNRWEAFEFKYRDDGEVNQLLEVKYTGGVRATIVLRAKRKGIWRNVLSCSGYVGSKGIGQAREGISRTPVGDFGITRAFGIKGNPGSNLPYVQVNSNLYWCGDHSYYNRLIDITQSPHDCAGEHLIDYSPYYDYGLFFDYNTNPIRYGAGSAFFVHCTGPSSPRGTGGCIAMSKSSMIKVIQRLDPGARLLIYSK